MRGKLIIILITLFSMFLYTSLYFNDVKTASGTKIMRTEYSETVNVSGEFEAENTTVLKLQYPFFVKEVFIEENDYVNKGQALFSIDTEKMRDTMNGEISEEVIAAAADKNISDIKGLTTMMQYADVSGIVYAPADGIVDDLNIYNGAFTVANSDILTIKEDSNIMARFTLSQQDYGKIKVGDKVTITPVAFPGYNYTGVITDKNAVVKKQMSVTGSKVMVDIFAKIDNPDKRISGGLQFSGVIETGDKEVKNMLGYDFLCQDESGEFVYILKNGKAFKKYVDTGVETSYGVEILTLFEKDTVFLSGEINEGSRVVIKGNRNELI